MKEEQRKPQLAGAFSCAGEIGHPKPSEMKNLTLNLLE